MGPGHGSLGLSSRNVRPQVNHILAPPALDIPCLAPLWLPALLDRNTATHTAPQSPALSQAPPPSYPLASPINSFGSLHLPPVSAPAIGICLGSRDQGAERVHTQQGCHRGPERPVRVQAHSVGAQACTHTHTARTEARMHTCTVLTEPCMHTRTAHTEARMHTCTARTYNRPPADTAHSQMHVHTRTRHMCAGLQTTRTPLAHGSHGPGTCQCGVLRLEGACLSRWWFRHREPALHAATGAAASQGARVPPGAGKGHLASPRGCGAAAQPHPDCAQQGCERTCWWQPAPAAWIMHSTVPPRPAQLGPRLVSSPWWNCFPAPCTWEPCFKISGETSAPHSPKGPHILSEIRMRFSWGPACPSLLPLHPHLVPSAGCPTL